MAITLEETAALMTDPVFLGRVRAAAMLVAYDVLNEDPNTPNHELRVTLAQVQIRVATETPMMEWILIFKTVQESGALIGDQELTDAIRKIWDAACGATTKF